MIESRHDDIHGIERSTIGCLPQPRLRSQRRLSGGEEFSLITLLLALRKTFFACHLHCLVCLADAGSFEHNKSHHFCWRLGAHGADP